MAEYLKLGHRKANFFQIFNEKLNAALNNTVLENNAALSAQRVFRGTRSRERIAKMNYAAGEIERIIRGKFGRNKAKAAVKAKRDSRQISLFNYLCIQIQKSFRGYYSRKYKQDQRRRKQYCKTLIEQGEKVRDEMERYSQLQIEREAVEAQRKKEEEFKTYAQNLHHLVSTKHIRGVYNPAAEFIETPVMADVAVEDHIRGVVKDLLRTKGISKTGLITDINGTKKIPLKGLKYRLSVQASAPYDAVEKEKKRQESLHKILTAGKGAFFSGGKTNLINKDPAPLCVGNPYMDSWANPMLVKGVPKDQQQLLDSTIQQKALFATVPEKPFVSLVGGNRSTALPNDVFDVIAEAQETGGAIQRHLGTTTMRFGLPQSADNRYDGTIPAPPIRASCTVKSTRPKIRSFALDIKAKTAGALPFTKEDKFEDEESQQLSINVDSSDDER